jgi:ComF family protein
MADHVVTARKTAMLGRLRTALVDAIYPPRCLTCPAPTAAPHGLCPSCWRDTHFIAGAACAACGAPLIGEAGPGDLCQRCLDHPPAWDRGRAATVYGGAARRAILAFKHGDRLDMARPLAGWLAASGGDLLREADLLAPVPLHWRRLMRRRYNQAAELARRLGRISGKAVAPDLLVRSRQTTPQERMTRGERHANQAGAIAVSRRRAGRVAGAAVLLIDDVMTSGATLSACADACREAGAARVDVLVLARVAGDGGAD